MDFEKTAVFLPWRLYRLITDWVTFAFVEMMVLWQSQAGRMTELSDHKVRRDREHE